MRRFAVTILVALALGLMAAGGRAQGPVEPTPPEPDLLLPSEPPPLAPAPLVQSRQAPTDDWVYPFALGAGAIVGVVIYNVVTTGIFFRPPPLGMRVGFNDLAMSRVYTVTAAVVGGWIANWLYNGQDREPMGPFTS